MNTITNKPAKKTSPATLIVSGICALLALLLTLVWFTPVVKIFDDSYTYSEILEIAKADENEVAAFRAVIIISVIMIVWAAIPKLWASIVGVIYMILPAVLDIGQILDWKSKDVDLAFGGNLIIPLAVLTIIAFIVKLVFVIRDRKQDRNNAAAYQPLVNM